MKTFMIPILLAGLVTACGGTDLNTENILGLPGSGVTSDGHCDKVLVRQKSLLTRDAEANDYAQLEKDCDIFVKKYPSTECRLSKADMTDTQASVKTADMKKDCADTVARIKVAASAHSTPTPTPVPVAVSN